MNIEELMKQLQYGLDNGFIQPTDIPLICGGNIQSRRLGNVIAASPVVPMPVVFDEHPVTLAVCHADYYGEHLMKTSPVIFPGPFGLGD